MADIALLVVEEFEKMTKKLKQQRQQQGRISEEVPAGDAAAASRAGEWGSWAAAPVRTRVAALKEPAAAQGLAAVDGFFSA